MKKSVKFKRELKKLLKKYDAKIMVESWYVRDSNENLVVQFNYDPKTEIVDTNILEFGQFITGENEN
jgi:hypothetical protein